MDGQVVGECLAVDEQEAVLAVKAVGALEAASPMALNATSKDAIPSSSRSGSET